MKKCFNCGKTGSLEKHHIIHGHGKLRTYETAESLADICSGCHRKVHENNSGNIHDIKMKLQLQAMYFKKGYDLEKVQNLMDGKLFLVNGEIWGMKQGGRS